MMILKLFNLLEKINFLRKQLAKTSEIISEVFIFNQNYFG